MSPWSFFPGIVMSVSQQNLSQFRRPHGGGTTRPDGEGRRKAIFITRKLFPNLSFTFMLKNEGYLFSKLLGLRFNFSNAPNINGILTFGRICSALIPQVENV